jgi:hypothetical protein
VLSWGAGVWLKLAVWPHAMHACWGWLCILACCLPKTVHPPPPTPDPFPKLSFTSAASRAHWNSQGGLGHQGHEHKPSPRARTRLHKLAYSTHQQQTATACCPVPCSPRGYVCTQHGGLSASLLLATQTCTNPWWPLQPTEALARTEGAYPTHPWLCHTPSLCVRPTHSCPQATALAAHAHGQAGSCGFGRDVLSLKVISYLCNMVTSMSARM